MNNNNFPKVKLVCPYRRQVRANIIGKWKKEEFMDCYEYRCPHYFVFNDGTPCCEKADRGDKV